MQGTQFSLFEVVYRRWRVFLLTSTTMALLVSVAYLAQPLRYRVSGTFLPKKTELRITESNNPSDVLEQLKFLDQVLEQFFRRDSKLTPESKLIKDDETLQQAIRTLNIEDHEGNPSSPRSLRRRIQLSNSAKKNQVDVSIYDSEPTEAKQIINQLMTIYVERFSPETQKESVNFTSVIQPHLVNADTLSKQAKQALYQIQLGTNQTPLAPVTKAGDQTLELQSIRISTQQQLSSIDSDIALLQQELDIATSERKTLLQSVIELSNVRKTVLEQLNDILERSKNDPSLGNRLSTLENEILSLQKNIIITQDVYSRFLEQQQTPWAINQSQNSIVRITRPAAIPSQGTRPFLKWFVGFGGLASLGAGVVASLITERRDNSLFSLRDLYTHLQLPIFGIVPHFSRKELSIQDLARQDGTEFQEFIKLTDPYTQIIRRFEITSLNRIPQVLSFTSATTDEGKSLTIANLAYLLAKRGQKILLLEADLFQASQNQYWHQSKAPGLCECITGKIPLGKALQRLHPNLDLLQGGDTSKKKDILLNSPGIRLLVQECRSRYDHILIDTPALKHSVHGYLLANCADVTLLIARPGKLNKAQIFNIKETINRSNQKLWGMIINDSTQKPNTSRNRKLIQDSQWDASIRLQNQGLANGLQISTLSAINPTHNDSEEDNPESVSKDYKTTAQARRDKQEAYLYQLPFEELHKLVDALWESWSHDIEILLEQEEEVVQQSRLVRELQEKVERGNPYLKLASELQLKEEKEKLNLLADTYVGQRPNLIEDRADLQFYLEILFARTDAEQIPVSQ